MEKKVVTEKYKILFNLMSGVEIMGGINGHPDPFKLEYPSMIDIGVMGHCINNCKFCYQGEKDEPNMTLDNFKQIIDESGEFTNQIALGGRGDPNLHEDFKAIVKYARDNKIAPNYTTSGINLTEEMVEITKEYCGAVAVSDYGTPHTYEALKRFMDADCKTNIHFVMTKLSFASALRLLYGEDEWNGEVDLDKLNAIIFLLFKPQGKGINSLDMQPYKSQTKIFSEMIKNPNCKFKVGMDSCMMNKVLQHREMTPAEKLCADTCEAGRMSMYITPDMKMLPCSFGDHELHGVPFNGSNVRKIQSIWQQEELFQQFRNILKKSPDCCPYEELWKEFKPLMMY